MGKIFQMGGLCSLCPLLTTWLITREYFPCEDYSISLVTTYFHSNLQHLIATFKFMEYYMTYSLS